MDQSSQPEDFPALKSRRFPSQGRISTRLQDLLFAVLLIVHLVPLWAFEYFPSQDGPAHLYNASIIDNYAREEFAFYREFYTLEHRWGVNWLIHLILAGLLELFPLLTAEKVLLTIYAVLFMLALRWRFCRSIQLRFVWRFSVLALSTIGPCTWGFIVSSSVWPFFSSASVVGSDITRVLAAAGKSRSSQRSRCYST